MDVQDVLKELEMAGSEQTRKTYRRHGIVGEMYGVSYAVLNTLKKKIKKDNALAKALWTSGNHDARILAMMIADPVGLDESTLAAWACDVRYPALAGAYAGLAAATPIAHRCVEAWTNSDDEFQSSTGWQILSHLAANDASLPDTFFLPYLETIRRDIHTRKNRVRHSMNGTLIGIGVRNAALLVKALEVAGHIGKVEVDHGDTDCKTPDAAGYICKTVAHRQERAAKATAA
jgi:3-methyladenine DNA glycosylase AlkD